MCNPRSRRQKCVISVFPQLSCEHAGGNPSSHAGWQNSRSAKHGVGSVLSAILWCDVLFSAMWWHQEILATAAGHNIPVVRTQYRSNPVTCPLPELRCQCTLWVYGAVFRYRYTGHMPSCSVCWWYVVVYNPVSCRSRLIRQRGTGNVFPNRCPLGIFLLVEDSNSWQILSKESSICVQSVAPSPSSGGRFFEGM
jgi:hypothetical protein